MGVLETVANVMNEYGIPRYVWEPIMRMESGGNPNAHNNKGEDSRGLFQINVNAHPQWKNTNLFDPAINATIAAQNFLSSAYDTAVKKYDDPADQTAYVWRYGIRPFWTDEKEKKIKQETIKVLGESERSDLNMSNLGNAIGDGITNTLRAISNTLFGTKYDSIGKERSQGYDDNYLDDAVKVGGKIKDAYDALDDPMGALKDFGVSAIVIIVGLVLLVLVLYSMFLKGGTQTA
jgi:hypothetical protein